MTQDSRQLLHLSAAEAREVAHSAYHDHNQNCPCKTVGHLTAWIAHRLLGIDPPTLEEMWP